MPKRKVVEYSDHNGGNVATPQFSADVNGQADEGWALESWQATATRMEDGQPNLIIVAMYVYGGA